MTREEALERMGLKPNATRQDIRKAYRQLIKAAHPDKNKAPGADHLFKLVQQAYEVLTSENRQEQEEAGARAENDRAEAAARAQKERERATRESRARAERERAEQKRAAEEEVRNREEKKRQEREDRVTKTHIQE